MIFKKIKSFRKIFGGRNFQMNYGFYIVRLKKFKENEKIYSFNTTIFDVVEDYTCVDERLSFVCIIINKRKEIFAFPNSPFCIKRL